MDRAGQVCDWAGLKARCRQVAWVFFRPRMQSSSSTLPFTQALTGASPVADANFNPNH